MIDMRILDKKYVFHIPLFKFEGEQLIRIPIDDFLDDLIGQLGSNGLYITKVKSHYKSRCFDELLLTLFVASDEHPEEIFGDWFRKNNDVLKQEAFAYECQNHMIICEL